MTFSEPSNHLPSTIVHPRALLRRAEPEEKALTVVYEQLSLVRERVIDLLAAYAALETRAMRDANRELEADIDSIREIAGINEVGKEVNAALSEVQGTLRRSFSFPDRRTPISPPLP